MGVKNLNSYFNEHISLEEKKWDIDISKYDFLRNNSFNYKQDEMNRDLVLVIDALAPFYEIGRKLHYFPLDYKIFIE